MLQLRCTAKVQKVLGIHPSELVDVQPGDSLLGNWYINMFTVDRRKTFIFVNEKTLLSFILFGIKKTNISWTPDMFLRGLDQLLTIESFSLNQLNRVFEGYDSYAFTKTVSKSVIGNMNDLMALYKHSILFDGGFKYVDIGKLILRINRTPQKNLGWTSSIELVQDLLKDENSYVA